MGWDGMDGWMDDPLRKAVWDRFAGYISEKAGHIQHTGVKLGSIRTLGQLSLLSLRGRQRQVWFIPLVDEHGVCR